MYTTTLCGWCGQVEIDVAAAVCAACWQGHLRTVAERAHLPWWWGHTRPADQQPPPTFAGTVVVPCAGLLLAFFWPIPLFGLIALIGALYG